MPPSDVQLPQGHLFRTAAAQYSMPLLLRFVQFQLKLNDLSKVRPMKELTFILVAVRHRSVTLPVRK